MILMFDIDFKYSDAEVNIKALRELETEGWIIQPSIDEINDENCNPDDDICCYAKRTWL